MTETDHRRVLLSIISVLFFSLSLPSVAEETVFMTRDANGNPVFSDQAADDAREIKIQTPQTFEAPPAPRFELGDDQEDPAEIGPAYEELTIINPENDSAMRNNAGNVTVQYVLKPGLQPNHTLELVVDGRVMKSQKTAAPISLQNLDRGTHVYQLRIIEDESGDVLQSSAGVSSTLQRVSVLRRAN